MHAAFDSHEVSAITYVVLDFETITHKGYAPEPVEVAALQIRASGEIEPAFLVDWLIQPPPHLPISVLEAGRFGMHPEDFHHKPPVAVALAQFDELCQGQAFCIGCPKCGL